MSYHVFTATRGGACAHMGEYPDHGAARAAWTLARPAGAIVTNAQGVVLSTTSTTPPALRTALESFARSFFAAPTSTPAAPHAPTPKAPRRTVREALSEGVVSPEASAPPSPPLATLCADDEHPVGVGAATEPPLPVPFDAPVVAEDQSAEIERLQNVVVELHEENKKLHAQVKRSTRGTTKPAPRVVETPVEFFHRYIRERAAGVGR